jgi:hypothetical protein
VALWGVAGIGYMQGVCWPEGSNGRRNTGPTDWLSAWQLLKVFRWLVCDMLTMWQFPSGLVCERLIDADLAVCCACLSCLQVPPVLNQFVTRALDKNQAETLFKLLLKYRCVPRASEPAAAGTCHLLQLTSQQAQHI